MVMGIEAVIACCVSQGAEIDERSKMLGNLRQVDSLSRYVTEMWIKGSDRAVIEGLILNGVGSAILQNFSILTEVCICDFTDGNMIQGNLVGPVKLTGILSGEAIV